MVMKLEQVIPFGRSLDEYQKMFNLSSLDLIVNQFSNLGYSVAIQGVPYEFQPGGNKMLVIKQN